MKKQHCIVFEEGERTKSKRRKSNKGGREKFEIDQGFMACFYFSNLGSVTIFVGDVDDEITDSELRQAFDPFGEIL